MRITLRNMARSRIRVILGCSLLALTLAIATLGGFTQNKHPQMKDDIKEAKLKYAKTLSPTVRKLGKLLKDAKVPFDSTILFSPNWRRRVDVYSGLAPDLTKVRTRGDKLKGVELADTLVLPEKVDLDGDTLIVVRQLIFTGKHVEVKGNHDLHIFQTEPILSTNDGVQAALQRNNGIRFVKTGYFETKSIDLAKQRGLLVQPESVTLSVNGYGAKEWLEDQKKKKNERSLQESRSAHHSLAQQNANGTPGQTGPTGDRGLPGVTPSQQATGATGNCSTNPDGGPGVHGDAAIRAGTGYTGRFGTDGGNAFTLTVNIAPGGSGGAYEAHGGKGGQGGTGGEGGFAAQGGQGGQGGPGKECDCNVGRSGTGGTGGTGGRGGQGGNGGPGGPGGTGGDGGVINIFKPCDWSGSYTTNVLPGERGDPGYPGKLSAGGHGGAGGPGGTAATNAECALLGGNVGQTGQTGLPGDPGDHDGDWGDYGLPGQHNGTVNTSTYGNCGGGSDYQDIEPSGYEDGCTEYDWVWVHCDYYEDEEDARLTQKYSPTVKADHYVRSMLPGRSSVPNWDCYVVDRWPAGCF